MPELLQEYWIFVLVALVIGVIVAWWIFHASRRTRVQLEDKPEGETGAKRNQALIDAAPAASRPVNTPEAGPPVKDAQDAQIANRDASPGPISAAANTDAVAAAPAAADAEAGAAVPAREAMKEVPLEAAEAPAPAPAPAPAAGESGDDLRRIKGLGPKLVTILAEQGVTSFAQIAAWTDADIDRVDATLGRFEGRIRRDNWVEQARLLAADDTAAYEERFGKL